MEGNDMTVNELLQEAKDLNFEAVIIIGYKDNDIKIKSWN
jgi:molybdopterin-guanine dinucleotide biosynthesis protein